MRTISLSLLLAALLALPFPGAAVPTRLETYAVGAQTDVYPLTPVACVELLDSEGNADFHLYLVTCGFDAVRPGNATLTVLDAHAPSVSFHYRVFRNVPFDPASDVCLEGDATDSVSFRVPERCNEIHYSFLSTATTGTVSLAHWD